MNRISASRSNRSRLSSPAAAWSQCGRPTARASRWLRQGRTGARPHSERLEDRVLLAAGPQLISIQPNVGDVLQDGVIRQIAPQQLTFVFNEQQQIDAATLGGVRITRAGFDGAFDGVSDVMIQPGFVGVDPDRGNEVIVRFAEALPDDLYRIEILAVDDPAKGLVALRNVIGDPFVPAIPTADRTTIRFELNLGPQIIAVVPQPIRRNADGSLHQARDQIVVYFNDDDLSRPSATNPAFYQLISTNGTVQNVDDTVHNPARVDYDPAGDTVTLTFASDLDQLSTGSGIYRLRIGTDEVVPAVPQQVPITADAGSSFATAMDLGALPNRSQVLQAAIEPTDYPLAFPGGTDEPGHRDSRSIESHFDVDPDSVAGITQQPYNFKTIYGWDPAGTPLFNLITEAQKARAREIFELFGFYLGIDVYETEDEGITIATGDLRAINPASPTGPGGTLGISGDANPDPMIDWPTAIMDNAEPWDDAYGITRVTGRESWFDIAMHEVGHLLGLGHTFDLPPLTVQGDDPELNFTNARQLTTPVGTVFERCSVDGATGLLLCPEAVFPGNNDIVHGRHLYRPEGNDIDVYRFQLTQPGLFKAQTVAERAADSSLLDSALTLYRQEGNQPKIIARNDDYFSEDSYLELALETGTYYLAVTASGNTQFDPTIADTGMGGTSEGPYELRLDFRPRVRNFLTDATAVALDGDADGVPGGVYNFWFPVVTPGDTVYVDKGAPAGGDGSLAQPLNNLTDALHHPEHRVQPGQVLRIVGNPGADGDLATLADNLAYEIGIDRGQPLPDGANFLLPQGVTAMIDAGAILKLQKSVVHVGSSAVAVDRSASALQVLGTPTSRVIFTSYNDEATGVDTNPRMIGPAAGDWGGIVFRNDVDRAEGRLEFEQIGAFLNYVGQADLRYGGGNVIIDSVQQVITPIHMVDARPTIAYNRITFSADAAVSANPDSFEETNFSAPDSLGIDYQAVPFTPDYQRIGPDLRGNRLTDSSINGLFIRITTPAGQQLETMTVVGRWDDTDVVHVVAENLVVGSTPGGPWQDPDSGLVARPDAQLRIDPRVVVKVAGARIEVEVGAQLLAEGLAGQDVVFTSLLDPRFGAGGTFVTSSVVGGVARAAAPGDWGGLYFWPSAQGSLDHAVLAFGGGSTRVEGSFARFNVIESYQATLRMTNSRLEENENGRGGQSGPTREGRGINAEGAIFIRGAQPVLVNNVIKGTRGFRAGAININANALNHEFVADWGRSTGLIDLVPGFQNNQGPLIRRNRLVNNSLNGMVVRGETLTTEGVWDDTDIVHIVFDEIAIPDFHTFGGLRLQSSPTESLVIKLEGEDAGFKATGRPLEIDDRIGGMLHVVGQPGRPVVITALADDSVGAGFDPSGRPQTDTDGFRRPPRQRPAGSFQIDLVFGPLIRTKPQVMEAIEQAARIWERWIEDPIAITLDIELDPNLAPGLVGVTTSENVVLDYDTVRQAMIADGRANESILGRLPNFANLNVTLPQDPGNPFSITNQMRVTRANALALGFAPALLPATPSQFDPTKIRDGIIMFHEQPISIGPGGAPQLLDYDRTDGLLSGTTDFVGAAVHEIGHALGFNSAVDDVDLALTGAGARQIQITTLDMFRLEPGRGEVDFTAAPRALDPRLTHVFHDGGNFDPFGLNIPGLRRGDIPLATGTNFGDGSQAGHWKEFPATIGLMDSAATVSREGVLLEADRIAFDLIGWDIVGSPVPGTWRGITLEQFSNDRNVQVATELEEPSLPAPGDNAVPSTAQLLGQLGRGEKQSDENLRLGFDVHGFLHSRSDVDVFSFKAAAGTHVWLDIDATSQSLDTVIELIDANGNVLARSDNSLAESGRQQSVFARPGILAFVLQNSPFSDKDFWTTNLKDAGFRVVLPGPLDVVGTYYVRVRSAGPDLSVISGGQTSGAYELAIRLQQKDELPGSTVQFADIRYATDGIRVRGLPYHSPLMGEVAEDVWEDAAGRLTDNNDVLPLPIWPPPPTPAGLNGTSHSRTRVRVVPGNPPAPDTPIPRLYLDSFQDAQFIGNILNTDRGVISIAGKLDDNVRFQTGNPDQVDWYLFEVRIDGIEKPGQGSPMEFIFDVDYADGLARGDLSLAIYEAFPRGTTDLGGAEFGAGQLIYKGKQSFAAEDRPAPLQGSDVADLSRGTVGLRDPWIGPVALPEGFYLLQLTSADVAPVEELQFTARLPDNPSVRVEPIESMRRIAEDRIAEPITDPGQGTTFDPPQVPLLLDPRASVVPFHLGDVELFVSTSSALFGVDAFTGTREVAYGALFGVDGASGTAPVIGDVALRNNPLYDRDFTNDDAVLQANGRRRQRLHAFALDLGTGAAPTDATVGAYLHIDPLTPNAPRGPIPAGNVAVRGTGDAGALTDDGVDTYEVDPNSMDPAMPDVIRVNNGVGEGIFYDALTFDPASLDVGIGYAIGRRPGGQAGVPINNILFRFDAVTGLVLSATGAEQDQAERIPVPAPIPTPAPPVPMRQPNAGTNIVEQGVLDTTFPDGTPGGNITGITFLGGSMYGASDGGGLFQIRGFSGQGATASYIATILNPDTGDPIRFAGLTTGPANVESRRYAQLLFGIDNRGALYAFDTDGVLQPVFVDGQLSISTGVRGATGLEFATLDTNLWHVTMGRSGDFGHGRIHPAPTGGANSFYFGEEMNPGGGDPRYYDFLGGAHGSLVSDPFSLAGYSAEDEPFLYFTYYLVSEDINQAARTAFRAFISDTTRDDGRGQWHLLASNNAAETGPGGMDVDPADDILINVQQLFDNTWQDVPFLNATPPGPNGTRDPFPYPDDDQSRPFDPGPGGWPPFDPPLNETKGVWRQARISLADFAGSDELRLRFDFSTAGGFAIGFPSGGVELHAIDGARLRDGDVVTIDGTQFEFDLGYTAVTPGGLALADGETITVDDGTNPPVTYELDRDGTVAPGNFAVAVTDNDTAADVADNLAAAITASGPAGVTPRVHDNRVHLDGAQVVTQSAQAAIQLEGSVGADGVPVIVHADMTPEEVAEALVQPLADTFAGGNPDVIKQYEHVVRVIGHPVDDPGPLGLVPVLPGDDPLVFSSSLRTQLAEDLFYDFPDDDFDFTIPREGVYVDDLVIGFASHGELSRDTRPVVPPPNDPFADDQGRVVPVPSDPTTIRVGEYQIEVRPASNFTQGGALSRSFDIRTRFSQTVTLVAPSGSAARDGQVFAISDGIRRVEFEFNDTTLNNGITPQRIEIPFAPDEPDYVIAERLRDAVNAMWSQKKLQIAAASTNGAPAGSAGTSNWVNLFGNALVSGDIETLVNDEFGGSNRNRDQGQLLIANNRISFSALFGIVVEDGLRDLPCTPGSPTIPLAPQCFAQHFDPTDLVDHGQVTAGDYTPHSGSVRNLRELNRDQLAPGVVIANNVVAFGGEGGIHFSGDPGGHVIIGPIGGEPGASEVPNAGNFVFTITDNNGVTEVFQFEGPGQTVLPFVPNPVIWAPTPDCPGIHNLNQCSPRYSPINPDMTDALIEAIARSNLDVTIYRGRGDEIFVEGARQILSRVNPSGPTLTADEWFYPFNIIASPASVPFGRIVNNTIVGLGGSLSLNNLTNQNDFRDVGILIEDNAAPTVLNNVVVNFQQGVAIDQTGVSTVLGGMLFQGNQSNTVGIGVGDFVLELPDDEVLFVDLARGNFYPAANSRLIDSSVDSLEDRPKLVTVKNPLEIARSPILAPDFDSLGQLRVDDPRVEPPDGFGRNVFKDRGAIDRADFVGPIAQWSVPNDNDTAGVDKNPMLDQVRLQDVTLTEFVIQLLDPGETGALTGAGIDDFLATSAAVIVSRDGRRLVPGIDYRFDYQPTTNQILLTPQAGVWLPGFVYEIELVNQDQFVIDATAGDQIPDAQTFQVTDARGNMVVFEFESGYTIQIPQPLTIIVPAGRSGLTAIADREVFTVSDGSRIVTFEFDNNGLFSSGRVPVRFTASSTPDQVAAAIATAIESAAFGLQPVVLGGGAVHIGGSSNVFVDTSLSGLNQTGVGGAIRDGQTITLADQNRAFTFEFDKNDSVQNGNIRVPFTDNDTHDQLADALVTAINQAGPFGVSATNVGTGRVHLGGQEGLVVRSSAPSLAVVGQPGLISDDTMPNQEVIGIVYQPSPDFTAAQIAESIQLALEGSTLSDFVVFHDGMGRLLVQGVDSITGINSQFLPGLRDLAGNLLRTNQDTVPFKTLLRLEMPVAMDFGDAPDPPYPTLLASDGARHVIVPNVFLGEGVDTELDARASADASGDNLDDGIRFNDVLAVGGEIPLTLTASAAGFVDAWIDFDRNGRFDHPAEQVLAGQRVAAGDNSLTISIPTSATSGSAFARFRYSTLGNLLPTGRADNGEAEDYAVQIEFVPPPVAADDAYTTDEDVPRTVTAQDGVLANDADPQQDPLVAVLVAPPSRGQLSLNQDGSFRYEPDPDYSGSDTFTYYATDGILRSETVTVTVTINSVPDPPIAVDDEVQTQEDTAVTINVVANDSDPDGALVASSVRITTPPADGTVAVNANGTVDYTPRQDFSGIDTFGYQVQDIEGVDSNEAIVSVTVTEVNDAPVAANDTVLMAQGSATRINVIANDTDVDGTINPLSVVITLTPKSGTVAVNPDGTVTFTPNPTFIGADTFRYTVRDNSGAISSQAVVLITVTGRNQPPTAVNDSAETGRSQRVRIAVLDNDSDVDGTIDPSTLTITQPPASGAAAVQADGTIFYTPDVGFVGTDAFRYTVADDQGVVSAEAVVTITVTDVSPPWQNPEIHEDVDQDGLVVPLDALLVINEINRGGSRPLDRPPLEDPPFSPPPYLDVSGDSFLSPIDALLIINRLNQPGTEGESTLAGSSARSALAADTMADEPMSGLVLAHEHLVAAALDIPLRRPDLSHESDRQLVVAVPPAVPRRLDTAAAESVFAAGPLTLPADLDRPSINTSLPPSADASSLDDELLGLLAEELVAVSGERRTGIAP